MIRGAAGNAAGVVSFENKPCFPDVTQPFARVFLQAPPHELPHWRRDAGWQRVPVRLARHHRGEHVGDRFAGERALRCQHFVEHAAKGPDVDTTVDGLSPRLFRRHVRRRAEDDTELGDSRGGERRRVVERGSHCRGFGDHRLGQAEVEYFDRAVRPDFYVGRLEIAMDDALLVRGFECVGYLPRDVERVLERDPGGAQGHVSERLAIDQLHDQRVHAATFLDAVNLRDVRMIERREDVRLTLEACTRGQRRRRTRQAGS